MKLTALALLATVPLLAGLTPHSVEAEPQPQDKIVAETRRSATVIFLRHAEALPRTRGNQNPDLAEAGKQRAKRWAKTLRAAGVTMVYVTELGRTQQTAAPLAKALGLKVKQYGSRKSREFANSLRDLEADQVAVVVGHSNTVPQMVQQLGGQLTGLDQRGYLQDTEHDRMIVQTLTATRAGEAMRAMHTLDLRVE